MTLKGRLEKLTDKLKPERPKFTIWGGLTVLGLNQKVFLDKMANPKRTSVGESTKPQRSSIYGSIKLRKISRLCYE